MKRITVITLGLMFSLAAWQAALAGGVKYQTGEGDYVKLGGRIQLQYHWKDPEGGERSDKILFRRLRPYIEGSVHQDWKGKFQWDMGKGGVCIKDAYFQYKGWKDINMGIGNMVFPFSPEGRTSSKYQQLVERTFVGDHNHGTPDRQPGIHVSGHFEEKTISWAASVAMGAIDPDNKKLDFDTPIQIGAGSDWSQGPMGGASIDWYPWGYFKAKQGDFKGDLKLVIGTAGFNWKNDGDNLDASRSKKDVDYVGGFEGHAGFRGFGFSLDAQYNYFKAGLIEPGIDSGIYLDSGTELKNAAIEAGYMILPKSLEIVLGYQVQDAAGYEVIWAASSVGLNYFILKHDVKLQLTYQMGKNQDGVEGNNMNELFVQTQYVF